MRILMVSDDLGLSKPLRSLLMACGYCVQGVTDGDALGEALSAYAFEVLLVDWALPVPRLTHVFTRVQSQPRVFPLLMLPFQPFELQGGRTPLPFIEWGSWLKNIIPVEAEAYDGDMTYGALRYDQKARRVFHREKPLDLSLKELHLFELFLSRLGQVMTKSQLAQYLYGAEDKASFNAVEVTLSRLRRKLAPTGVVFKTLRGIGYRLEPLL